MVVPARAGSKRIPGKNIKEFNGSPMITWPISACLGSSLTETLVVSTDGEDIADVARSAGAERVVKRPALLASDTAGTAPVVKHTLDELGVSDDTPVACVYPTAPITTEHFESALELSGAHPHEFVISVGRHRAPFERSLTLNAGGKMSVSNPEHVATRTQDLPVRFFDAGKLYIAPAGLWRSQPSMMSTPFVPFFLPPWATVDIDEPDDWSLAEALHRAFVIGF